MRLRDIYEGRAAQPNPTWIAGPLPTGDRKHQAATTPEPERPTPGTLTAQALAVSVLAENKPDEVGKILGIWKETFGLELDRNQVARRLEGLREWKKKWARG